MILLGLENSDIVANAFRGNGGQIRIKADQIYGLEYRSQLTPDNDITATSQFGSNGLVSIDDLRLERNAGLLPLPIALSDEKQRITDRCETNRRNRFIITGRGGLPKTPTWNLDSNRAWRDVRKIRVSTPEQPVPQPAPRASKSEMLIEASNWQKNGDGTIELVAPGAQKIAPLITANCGNSE
jgi:large exoprotein involved in heme utilization and adhesion